VPRFYLRGFSRDEKRRTVSLFNVQRKLYVRAASIKHEASRSHFYGRDGIIEDSLMQFETGVAEVFDRILRHGCAPAHYSFDHQALLAHILMQRRRTPRAGRELIDSLNKPLAIAFREDRRYSGIGDEWVVSPENPVAAALGFSSWLWPLLLDLKCKLLITNLSPGFITSDNPVVYYNQYLESRRPHLANTGLLTRGLQVFLPLCPEALIALYDGAIYKAGSRDLPTLTVTSRADLDAMNALQAASADRNLYFSSDTPSTYARSLAQATEVIRKSYHVSADEYRSASDPHSGLIHVRSPEIRSNLVLSFVRLHRRVRKLQVGTSALIPRDREMWDLVHDFVERTKEREYGPEDLFSFLAINGKLRPTVASFPRRMTGMANASSARSNGEDRASRDLR